MVEHGRWEELETELARWADEGRVAEVWLRDDDAVEPTPALERLIALAGRYGVPATLAVIPAHTGEALAARLAAEPAINMAVHGWAHRNHAPADAKKAELGPHRPAQLVIAELAEAKAVIDRLFDERAVPVLVPPWNRISRDVLPLLGGIGFAALSVYGRAGDAPLPLVNTHVDPIDWHGRRGCRDHGDILAGLVGELRWRRESGSREPVGILTHHLVHDEAAWSFLDRLFEVTAGDPACRWAAVRELV